MLRIPQPLGLKLRQNSINLIHLLPRQFHLDGVLSGAGGGRAARDGYDDGRHARAAREAARPGECQLRGRAALALGQGVHEVVEGEVVGEVGLREAREGCEVGRDGGGGLERAAEDL